MVTDKVLIVEGRQYKLRILPVLNEAVEIICTNGTISEARLEELLAPYEDSEMYVFFDADHSGEKARKLVQHYFPHAAHLYTLRMYKQVEHTPRNYLAAVLADADFQVNPAYLIR